MPTLTIFAGINGAGKSTFYKKNFNKTDLGVRINPDEMLLEFHGNWQNKSDQLKSGILSINKINELLNNNQSFNWEMSLLSNYNLEYIRQAKSLGYKINLYFIGLSSLEVAKNRILARIKKGGHGISDKILTSKFRHQFDNIVNVLDYVDCALFYDSTKKFTLVAEYKNNNFTYINKNIFWSNLFTKQNPQSLTEK